MLLYRAVSVAERDDILVSGIFRPAPQGITLGKWFALRSEDAVRWGRQFFAFDAQPIFVAEAHWEEGTSGNLLRLDNLDNIGPAIFIETVVLSQLKPIILPDVPFAPERPF